MRAGGAGLQVAKPDVAAIVKNLDNTYTVLRCDGQPDAPARFRKVIRRHRVETYGAALGVVDRIEGKDKP